MGASLSSSHPTSIPGVPSDLPSLILSLCAELSEVYGSYFEVVSESEILMNKCFPIPHLDSTLSNTQHIQISTDGTTCERIGCNPSLLISSSRGYDESSAPSVDAHSHSNPSVLCHLETNEVSVFSVKMLDCEGGSEGGVDTNSIFSIGVARAGFPTSNGAGFGHQAWSW